MTMMRPRAVAAVLRKELRLLARDRRTLPLLLLAPILQLLLYGYAATFDLDHLPVAVLDQDGSVEARELAARVEASGSFRVAFEPKTFAEVEALVDRGETRAALVIPRGFGRAVREGRVDTEGFPEAAVGLFLDGSDSNAATIVASELTLIARRHGIDLVLASARERLPAAHAEVLRLRGAEGVPELVEARPRVLYNPDLRSAAFMVPGVVCMILLVLTVMLSSLSIVKEKELGTFETLAATPIRPSELIVGKLAPFVLIGFVDVLLVLGVAIAWFEVPFRGSAALLLALASGFLLSTLALGLFVSTVAETQQQAMVASFGLIMPMVLLSGFIFPIDGMPRPMQVASLALPMRYFLVAIRSIFLKGVGLDVLWDEAAALFGLGALLLLASAARFRKTRK
jgi:ABC-2 type transport system permease protein